MASGSDLRLQVILQAIDRATAPFKRVTDSSSKTARALRDARDKLKELNTQQKAVGEFRELRGGLKDTALRLGEAQGRVNDMARALHAVGPPSKAMTRDFAAAKREAAALSTQHQRQAERVQALRDKLAAAGISTSSLGSHERRLRGDIDATTRSIDSQTTQLKAQAAQHRRVAELKAKHAKAMLHTGVAAGAGVAGIGIGRAVSRPLAAAVGAYAPQEDASTQLQASMMRSDGSVSAEFSKITELANRLGDRLPGTTADFQNMMTMLIRQGMSAQTILGGLGESAAYLGVQLQMPVTEAAEFAAKMQDATRTTEADMMGLMDVIQRTYYLGVDSGNMLQGFTKLSPVLSILRKEGLEGSKALAPLLVMMDQTGMAGESAGNAIRKVFQAGLDAKRLEKANDALKSMGAGFQFDFTDGAGKFAGIDKVFEQVKKINTIKGDVQRTGVIKALFGDDAETLQVVNTLMAKGQAGYQEIVAKMEAQADLRKRVDKQLGTLTNLMEAAQGSFTNLLAQVGEAFAPELKQLVAWIGDVTSQARTWVAENPKIVATVAKVVAVVAALYTGLGALLLAFASIVGPMLITRFLFARTAAMLLPFAGPILGALVTGLKLAGGAVMFMGKALLMNPIGLAITGIAIAALLIYRYWGPITAFFGRMWEGVKLSFTNALAWVGGLVTAFYNAGTNIIQGMANGIVAGMGAVREAVTGAAGAALGWFKEKLGIQSPSRVFMEAGTEIGNGAALGISSRQGYVRQAALGVATAAATVLPMAAGAGDMPRIDSRAPISASAAPAAAGAGDTISITIHAAPGMDAQAIARAVSAELDRRQHAKSAARRSQLSDID